MYILKEEEIGVGFTWRNCKVCIDRMCMGTTRDRGLSSYIKRKNGNSNNEN